jgi:23S rRNA G2445 N2-methylase RlmL
MNRDKELYRQLRGVPWDELWSREVPRFNSASAKQRLERVAVIRAVGVVFSESGPIDQLPLVKTWLHSLLKDPCEKIRRYAVAALPKLGREERDEKELLTLAKKAGSDREKQHVASALAKIGGQETLRHAEVLPPRAVQRVKANVLRAETSSAINFTGSLRDFGAMEILLRGRAGLETFVRDEVDAYICANGKFRVRDTKTGLVVLTADAPFSLAEIFTMRCFGAIGFALPTLRNREFKNLATAITSPAALKIFRAFANGPIRYRLDFVDKGHQRAAVRELAELIYSKNSELINGGGDTPWTIEIQSTVNGVRIVLAPKLMPDPRFAYRQRDVPAASHPPLAACMARLAALVEGDIVWDPFCGSGLELIERSRLGGVSKIIGTDRSAEAIEITRQNFAAAGIQNVQTQFVCSDFRNFDPGPTSLIITNPPMGKRVPIANLRQLISDLFEAAARFLQPGGRLVFANPLGIAPANRLLKREFSQLVDFGGFHCRVEKYVRI